MRALYSISIFIYSFLIKFASIFNNKAKLRTQGVNNTFDLLKIFNEKKVIWIHCASLGEFEQGRPLIEQIKKETSEYKIALSFFSPSGYEIQKEYEYADIVFYLPNDTKANSKRLIKLLRPQYVFFIKYEFWHWYLSGLKENNIPTYLVSGIFRKNQIFFKPYGGFYKKILKKFKHLFVQNETSKKLLGKIGIENLSVTGDTRFDRVYEISKKRKELLLIDKFKGQNLVFIAGSTWKDDEEIIFKYINKVDIKLIIAPHEIKKDNIERIMSLSKKNILKYSEATEQNINNSNILLIDNVGLLSSLYAYSDIAYIGGGFGSGIHNILEAAVFSVPIIFGPKYQKFDEAKELIKIKGAYSVINYQGFVEIIEKLISDSVFRKNSGNNSKIYINENIGATKKILKEIKILASP